MADPATTIVSGEGVFLTVMRRWSWLRTAITVAACLAPAAAAVSSDRTRPPAARHAYWCCTPFLKTLPKGHFPKRLHISPSVSGSTGRCWVTHWAISLDYYSELLDRYHFPDPSYESDFEELSRAQVWRPDDRPADREWPGRGRSCGAVTGAARVSTADRVHRPRCAAASSQIDRPYLSVCHERVARFGAAGASRHPPRVRRVRRISAGCMVRRRVSLAGARAAARRGVHLLARTLRYRR